MVQLRRAAIGGELSPLFTGYLPAQEWQQHRPPGVRPGKAALFQWVQIPPGNDCCDGVERDAADKDAFGSPKAKRRGRARCSVRDETACERVHLVAGRRGGTGHRRFMHIRRYCKGAVA